MSNVGIINGGTYISYLDTYLGRYSTPSATTNQTSHSPAISIVTDIIFVAIPVHVVKGLQVNKRTRWTLIGIMSLGLV